MSKSRKSEEADKMIRRTTFSKSGEIKEHDIPLSSLKREAIDLSADIDAPIMSLLLTREAAVRITEQAIATALTQAETNIKPVPQPETDIKPAPQPRPASKKSKEKSPNLSRAKSPSRNKTEESSKAKKPEPERNDNPVPSKFS